MISTGHMTEQVVWQTSTRSSDGQGGNTVTWSDLATEWANVSEISTDRLLSDDGVKFTKAIRIRMRERGDTYTADPKYRISWNSQYWTVYSVVTNSSRTEVIAYTRI